MVDHVNSAATIAMTGLVVSLLTAVFVYWQVTLSRRSLGAETLLQLGESWRSERMLRTRSSAATALLERRTAGATVQAFYESNQTAVDEVLYFFETVAFFCKRKVLDRDLVWSMFYWPLENYALACSDYIDHVRLNAGSHTWANLSALRPRLQKLNRGDAAANDATVPRFLRAEAALLLTSGESLPAILTEN
jgi:hypothetical protein